MKSAYVEFKGINPHSSPPFQESERDCNVLLLTGRGKEQKNFLPLLIGFSHIGDQVAHFCTNFQRGERDFGQMAETLRGGNWLSCPPLAGDEESRGTLKFHPQLLGCIQAAQIEEEEELNQNTHRGNFCIC